MKSFPWDQVERARVLVIGDVMLDRYWFGQVERISPEAPVPVVRVMRKEDRLGGAANVARNIVALGAQATLIGLVGADSDGQTVRTLLQADGIQERLVVDEQRPTTLKLRVIGRQQQLIRVDFEEQPTSLALSSIHQSMRSLLAQHDVVVLSDYAKGALKEVQSLITLARQAKIPVLVDPKGEDYSRYHGATLLTPNRLEMKQAVGAWQTEEELEHKAQQLRQQLALEALLFTGPERGLGFLLVKDRTNEVAKPKKVFDSLVAGVRVLPNLPVGGATGWKFGR